MDKKPLRTSGGLKWVCMPLTAMLLNGCAYIPHKSLVDGTTSAQPAPASAPLPNGSIFQAAQPMNYGYQPLFEDRRPRNVGDTLTITLQENVSASKSSSANASRNGASKFGVATSPRYLEGLLGNARADMDISGDNTFGGKGGRMPTTPSVARSPLPSIACWLTATCMWSVKNRLQSTRGPNLSASLG